jgi:hypothetical protein
MSFVDAYQHASLSGHHLILVDGPRKGLCFECLVQKILKRGQTHFEHSNSLHILIESFPSLTSEQQHTVTSYLITNVYNPQGSVDQNLDQMSINTLLVISKMLSPIILEYKIIVNDHMIWKSLQNFISHHLSVMRSNPELSFVPMSLLLNLFQPSLDQRNDLIDILSCCFDHMIIIFSEAILSADLENSQLMRISSELLATGFNITVMRKNLQTICHLSWRMSQYLSISSNNFNTALLDVIIALIKLSWANTEFRQAIDIFTSNIYNITPSMIQPLAALANDDLVGYSDILRCFIHLDNRIRDEMVASNLFLHVFAIYDSASESCRRESCMNIILSIVQSNREQVANASCFTRYIFNKIQQRFYDLALIIINEEQLECSSNSEIAEYVNLSMLLAIMVESPSAYRDDILNSSIHFSHTLLEKERKCSIKRLLIVGIQLLYIIGAVLANQSTPVEVKSLTVIISLSENLLMKLNAMDEDSFGGTESLSFFINTSPRFLRYYLEILSHLLPHQIVDKDSVTNKFLHIVQFACQHLAVFPTAMSLMLFSKIMHLHQTIFARDRYWSSAKNFADYRACCQLIIPAMLRALLTFMSDTTLSADDNNDLTIDLDEAIRLWIRMMFMELSSASASQIEITKSSLAQLVCWINQPLSTSEDLNNVLISWMEQNYSCSNSWINSLFVHTLMTIPSTAGSVSYNSAHHHRSFNLQIDLFMLQSTFLLPCSFPHDVKTRTLIDDTIFEWIISQAPIIASGLDQSFHLLIMLLVYGRNSTHSMQRIRSLMSDWSSCDTSSCTAEIIQRLRLYLSSNDPRLSAVVARYFQMMVESIEGLGHHELRSIFLLSSLTWRIGFMISSAESIASDSADVVRSIRSVSHAMMKSPNPAIFDAELAKCLVLLFIATEGDVLAQDDPLFRLQCKDHHMITCSNIIDILAFFQMQQLSRNLRVDTK